MLYVVLFVRADVVVIGFVMYIFFLIVFADFLHVFHAAVTNFVSVSVDNFDCLVWISVFQLY